MFLAVAGAPKMRRSARPRCRAGRRTMSGLSRCAPRRPAPYRNQGFHVSRLRVAVSIFELRSRDENLRTEPSRKKLSEGRPTAVRCWRARCEVAGHNEGLVTEAPDSNSFDEGKIVSWPAVQELSTELGWQAPNRKADDRRREEGLHWTAEMPTVGAFIYARRPEPAR